MSLRNFYSLRLMCTVLLLFSAVANFSLFTLHSSLFSPSLLYAQNDSRMRQVYAQAENDYETGRIEQARDTLLKSLNNFHGNMRQNALRLIALSYLSRFDSEQTTHYATLLLEQNPYYSPSTQDPPAFADIVNNIKAGMNATITTASSQAESLAEVPVPTTLITTDMIQNCGGRNLQEVLAAYVPGMNIVDCNDDINIAMRGIYSNTQEKILFMLNGHRLNSYATNTAAPDFSISLEKVKQIEVLRGPASSLYGGVALTAVVNIITKQGADVDGLQAKVGGGNYGQVKADLLFGKRYFDIDMLVWGSLYHSRGEERDVTGERVGEVPFSMPVDNIRIGRMGNQPSHDFGIQLGWKGMQFLYDSHFSHVAAPFTLASLAMSYDYDRYRTYNGVRPGFSTFSQHADLSYSHQIGHLDMKYAATYDKSDLTRYQIINDMAMPSLGRALSLSEDLAGVLANYGGISRYVNGQEQDYGLQVKGNYNYTLGDNQKGMIGFGAEYGHFQLNDMRYQIGYDFENTINENPVLRNKGRGKENSTDVYLQLKHQWHSFIVNAGLRFDHKQRSDDSHVNELSPRIALILLQPRWNMKLSYSKSFVDAPYIYRKANVLSTLMTGETEDAATILSPERVHSLQLSFATAQAITNSTASSSKSWLRGLNVEINGFYNRAEDLIMTHVISYENASKNQTAGLELMASYSSPQRVTGIRDNIQHPRFTANVNFTWTHTFKANLMGIGQYEDYDFNIDANNNTPAVMSNIVVGWQATPRIRLHGHLLIEGKQTSYNTDLVKLIKIYSTLDDIMYFIDQGDQEKAQEYIAEVKEMMRTIVLRKDMPARAIVNLGGEYQTGTMTFGLNIHNLLGTHYYRSGMNTNLIPQQGRWFMATIGVRL